MRKTKESLWLLEERYVIYVFLMKNLGKITVDFWRLLRYNKGTVRKMRTVVLA